MKFVLRDALKLKTKAEHFGKNLISSFSFFSNTQSYDSVAQRQEMKKKKKKADIQCPELLAEQCGLLSWANIWEKDVSQLWLDTLGQESVYVQPEVW